MLKVDDYEQQNGRYDNILLLYWTLVASNNPISLFKQKMNTNQCQMNFKCKSSIIGTIFAIA